MVRRLSFPRYAKSKLEAHVEITNEFTIRDSVTVCGSMIESDDIFTIVTRCPAYSTVHEKVGQLGVGLGGEHPDSSHVTDGVISERSRCLAAMVGQCKEHYVESCTNPRQEPH